MKTVLFMKSLFLLRTNCLDVGRKEKIISLSIRIYIYVSAIGNTICKELLLLFYSEGDANFKYK